ncbi:MAG: sugar/nucleoside kinase (ribokinase family) [Flavobacteriaceae bacterium]
MEEHGDKSAGVLCVGRVYCDIIFTGIDNFPKLGEEKFASGVSLHAGGGAYITAAYLASLGRPVSLLATLPSGPFAGFIRDELVESGINIDHCVVSECHDGPQLTVALSMQNDRAFITKRSSFALPCKTINWQDYSAVSHLHIGELAMLAEYPSLVEDAHKAGVTVSLDCSWDDEVFARKELDSLLSDVDIFLPNEAEFEQLTNIGFCVENTRLCVVKMGALGARAIQGGETLTRMAKVTDVVDTTGAGDAFNSGFINGWLNGMSLGGCLVLGNECGARAVSVVGGFIVTAKS